MIANRLAGSAACSGRGVKPIVRCRGLQKVQRPVCLAGSSRADGAARPPAPQAVPAATAGSSAAADSPARPVSEPAPAATSSRPQQEQQQPRALTGTGKEKGDSSLPSPSQITGGMGVSVVVPGKLDRLQRATSPGSRSSDEEEDERECPVFVDPHSGEMINVMCCDYGFRTGRARVVSGYGEIPKSAWSLATANFNAEWGQLRRSFRYDEYNQVARSNPATGPLGKLSYALGSAVVRGFAAIDQKLEDSRLFGALLPNPEVPSAIDATTGSVSKECRQIRNKLRQLVLSNDAVWARERAREEAGGGVETPWYVRAVYYALCIFLDVAYNNRPLQRFWFLETVARMPYFSYQNMLHLYETLGWWRAGAELRKVHFAEEWNELHHLQIMESLGGDALWIDRFMGQHAAILYYVILMVLFVASPGLAYNFSELIEAHAVDTYGEFADANADLLLSLPPPVIAVQYYRGEDLYFFDQFQTSSWGSEPRRPECNNLYDVFNNIRDDEAEHVATMSACQDMSIADDLAVAAGLQPSDPGKMTIWD